MTTSAHAADFAPGLLAIQENPPPRMAKAVLYAVVGLCALMLAWAMLGKLDVVAVAEGRLVPQTYVKIVQPAEAGVISEILVAEGDFVRAGQALIRLDATVANAEARHLAGDVELRRLTLRRIDSELAGAEMAGRNGDSPALLAQVRQQGAQHVRAYEDALAQETAQRRRLAQELKAAQETVNKLKATLPLYEQSAAAHRKLVSEGFVSALAGNEKERDAIEKAQDLKSQMAVALGLQEAITAQDRKVAALTSNFRSQLLSERTEAMAALARLEQESSKAAFKHGLLELKAPQDGIVKDLATTSRGAVVQPGMVLLTLVPKGETLIAEVQVRNEDIGFVQPGQAVRLKLAAYPFQKYGLLDGSIVSVAADAQSANPTHAQQASDGAQAQGLAANYKAMVKLKAQQLEAESDGSQRRFKLEAGMQVSAEIHQGNRTVMEYLLSPMSRTLMEAGRER
ncbi:MAG: HlyD family type I secretion periplasmic adaptor subunit [Ramlibacter sp.]